MPQSVEAGKYQNADCPTLCGFQRVGIYAAYKAQVFCRVRLTSKIKISPTWGSRIPHFAKRKGHPDVFFAENPYPVSLRALPE